MTNCFYIKLIRIKYKGIQDSLKLILCIPYNKMFTYTFKVVIELQHRREAGSSFYIHTDWGKKEERYWQVCPLR